MFAVTERDIQELADKIYKSAGRILRLDIPLDIVVRRPSEFENCAGDPL
jgi:hypothetical protein